VGGGSELCPIGKSPSRLVKIYNINKFAATYVAANISDKDWEELECQLPIDSKTYLGMFIADNCDQRHSFYAEYRGTPAMVFGITQATTSVWSAWAFGTDLSPKCIPVVSRFIRHYYPSLLLSLGATRVEVRSIINHSVAHRWLKSLGAAHDCFLVEQGKNGETFCLYSWTKSRWLTQHPET